jgi:hypothetical protein
LSNAPRARNAFTDALLDGPVRAWGLPQTTIWLPSGRWHGIRDFRGVAVPSGADLPSFQRSTQPREQPPDVSWREAVGSCSLPSLRASPSSSLAQDPDFQSGTGAVYRSHSVSLGNAPSQESPHLAQRPGTTRLYTERDGVRLTLTEKCHQECHQTPPGPRSRRSPQERIDHRPPLDRAQLRC